MKIYVIPDIHGMLNELKNAMSFFYEDFKSDDSKLVFLGDYIHGGEDSVGVVNYIIALQEKYGRDKVVALLGNHEEFVLKGHSSLEEIAPIGAYPIEAKYMNWFASLPRYYHESHTIFVHAGIDEYLGENWEYTDEYTYTNKYPAVIGGIDGVDLQIVAGHVYTSEIANDLSFHDIYYDGFNHYYLDGDVVKNKKLNVMLVVTGEKEDQYFEITEKGKCIVSTYY